MAFPLSESKTLGGLYVRHLTGRIYAVTHGNAIFAGESHIRFMEGTVLYASEPGKWTIFVLPNGTRSDLELPYMSAYIAKAEDIPDGAAIISEVEALA